jgi:hypothetical protein
MSRNVHSAETIMNALREAALIRPVSDHPESSCLTTDAIVAFADGRLSDSERLAWTPHLGSCRRCQRELASLVRTLNDPAVLDASRISKPYRRRLTLLIVPLAAAAAIILTLALPRERQLRAPGVQHRELVLTPGNAPMIGSPMGTVAEVESLQWSAVPHAELYRVTLFDDDGDVLFEKEVAEPHLALPETVKLLPENQYLWQVQARIGFGRWISSDLVEFRVSPPNP